ncbi:MAG: VOC family protein [Burkholderiales bacterium]|nr:VOC family protein [Burkholderiales bacterium]
MTPFSVQRIDHVVLRCRSFDPMLEFYCGVLGFEIAKRNERRGLIHLRGGTAMIDLVALDGELGRAGGAAPGIEGRNMDHFCLRIEPFDFPALQRHFGARGIELGELRTRFGAEGDGLSCYLRDPEGNRVELKGPASA